MRSLSKSTLIVLAGVVIVILLLVIPVRVPGTVSAYGKVMAASEWVLMRSDNGMIISVLRDNRTGAVRQYDVTQLERGDAFSFSMLKDVATAVVRLGDTVAWTLSTDVEYELAALRGSLAVAEAALDAARAGEKQELVDEAQRRVTYARKAVEEQTALTRRLKELHARQMVSDEEFELAEDRLELLGINVGIAEAQFAAGSSGARPAEIRQRSEEIEAIRGEIRAMEQRLALSTHVSPVSGRMRMSRAADTLLVVEDTTNMLLLMPVSIGDLARIEKGSAVGFSSPELGVCGKAVSDGADSRVQYLNGHAVKLLCADIHDCPVALPTGLMLSCDITAKDIPLHRYLGELAGRLLE